MAGGVDSVEEYGNMGAARTKQETKGVRLPELAILLVALTFLAYIPALRCSYIWDDDIYVTGNGLLTAPDGLTRIWFLAHPYAPYFPMVNRAQHRQSPTTRAEDLPTAQQHALGSSKCKLPQIVQCGEPNLGSQREGVTQDARVTLLSDARTKLLLRV